MDQRYDDEGTRLIHRLIEEAFVDWAEARRRESREDRVVASATESGEETGLRAQRHTPLRHLRPSRRPDDSQLTA